MDSLPCRPSVPGIECTVSETDYFMPLVAAISAAAFFLAFVSRQRNVIDFTFANVGGVIVIYALNMIQTGGAIWWHAVAVIVSIDAMTRVNRFFGLPNNRRERREARQWDALFGRETFWNLLINDPRRKTWRHRTQ